MATRRMRSGCRTGLSARSAPGQSWYIPLMTKRVSFSSSSAIFQGDHLLDGAVASAIGGFPWKTAPKTRTEADSYRKAEREPLLGDSTSHISVSRVGL